MKTFVDLVEARVEERCDAIAYRFLATGDVSGATETLTYRELGARTRSLAIQLLALKATGERALLLYPAGRDFVTAFLGCLYSGTIAVPGSTIAAHFNSDHQLVTTTVRGAVSVIDLSVSDWIKLACRGAGRALSPQEWNQFLPTYRYEKVCAEETEETR